jgi:hypothetical protein
MTNLKTAALRLHALEEAARIEARAKGIAARAYNRPREGVLVPKAIANTPDLLAEFQKGWDWLDAGIKADEAE